MLTDYQKLKAFIRNWVHNERFKYLDFKKEEIIEVHLSASSGVRKKYTINRIKNIILQHDLKLKVWEPKEFEFTDRFIISKK